MISRLALILALVAPIGLAAQTAQAPAPGPARFETEIVVTPERVKRFALSFPPQPSSSTARCCRRCRRLILEVLSFLPGFHVARAQFHAGRP